MKWRRHSFGGCWVLAVKVTTEHPPKEMEREARILKAEIWTTRTAKNLYIGFSDKDTPGLTMYNCLIWDHSVESPDYIRSCKRYLEKKIKEYITLYKLKIVT